jgi:hypothetical protein
LVFGFAFRVVRIVGEGFRVGGSPQALRDWLFEARRTAQHPQRK